MTDFKVGDIVRVNNIEGTIEAYEPDGFVVYSNNVGGGNNRFTDHVTRVTIELVQEAVPVVDPEPVVDETPAPAVDGDPAAGVE